MRPGGLGKAPRLRTAVHRFYLSGVQSTRHQHVEFAVAIFRQLEMSCSDLCALRRVFARWKFVAQPGKRVGVCALSGFKHRDSKKPCEATGFLLSPMHGEE